MQVNKNGFRIHVLGKAVKKDRVKPEFDLGCRRFKLIDSECDVEVVLPNFSPIIELMKKDGWVEKNTI